MGFFRKLLELPGAVWFSDDTAGMLKVAFPTGEVVKVTSTTTPGQCKHNTGLYA